MVDILYSLVRAYSDGGISLTSYKHVYIVPVYTNTYQQLDTIHLLTIYIRNSFFLIL